MKVLLTGSSGFLGNEIGLEIAKHNELISIGRNNSNQILCDLASTIPHLPEIDAVIHAAGKAHVYPKTDAEIKEFFDVNVNGTQNLLNALAFQNIKSFVFISSVSVYGLEQGELIEETNPLNGHSPYSKSKIVAEKLIADWCIQKSIPYLILRLPLIAGNNPPGNLGKMMHAIKKGYYLRIAKGNAKKSMVLAADIANFINNYIQLTNPKSGIYNLTDGQHPSFFELENAISKAYNKLFIPSIPKWMGTILGSIGDQLSFFPINSNSLKKITNTFTFSDDKARKELNWNPSAVLSQIITITK